MPDPWLKCSFILEAMEIFLQLPLMLNFLLGGLHEKFVDVFLLHCHGQENGMFELSESTCFRLTQDLDGWYEGTAFVR